MDRDEQAQLALGARLRAVRQQQGLTLQDVEDRSEGRWKAVVVGSYERADRAVSIARLADLADFYGVPVADLLPESAAAAEAAVERELPVVIDVSCAERLGADDPRLQFVSRYVAAIRAERGDSGEQLTLRSEDLRIVAVAMAEPPDELRALLEDRGVLTAG